MRSEVPSLADVLRAHAERIPDRRAYLFLANGTVESESLSYRELDSRARRIAAQLQELAMPGDRALLLYPPGLEFIAALFGCFYAGVVAVPAYPPRPHRANARLRTITIESQPTVALTTSPILARREPLEREIGELRTVRWSATDTLPDELAERWEPLPVAPDAVAFLQYTSGSTADPKGVMVSHRNLLHNERVIRDLCAHTEETVFAGWLPLYHDMGLMGNVLQPLYVGGRCVLMAPSAFLQSPIRWLQAIDRYRATTSGGPNFAYDLCVRRIGAEQRSGLDLSTWSVAFNGAEPVRAETLERFAKAFAGGGFRRRALFPCYGLAEATLLVTGADRRRPAVTLAVAGEALARHRIAPAPAAAPGARVLVSSGRAAAGHRVLVVDPASRARCRDDEVGEIWVAGPSVAQGYWRRREETAAVFHASLSKAGGDRAGTWLRTGDLGFLHRGELFVTGRLKDLVIIRGQNHYPQDIEWTVEQSHPALQPASAAAFAVEAEGEERLVVVVELRPRSREEIDRIAPAVRWAVAAEHQIRVHTLVLAPAGTVPKTTSGKVRRTACRDLFLAGELAALGSSSLAVGEEGWSGESPTREDLLALDPAGRRVLLETFLRREVGRLCGLAADVVDMEEPLTGLGLDSLVAMELEHAIEQALGVAAPVDRLLDGMSALDLAAHLLAELAAHPESPSLDAPPVAEREEMPLSAMQKALWFEQRLAPESPAYNVSFAARLSGEVDGAALRRAFAALVERHPALRTTLALRGDEPVQRVASPGELAWEERDASDADADQLLARLAAEAERPFDLAAGPLLRVVLFSRSPSERMLLVSAHHTVIDGWSLWVLLDELRLLYPAALEGRQPALPPVLGGGDFALWQGEMLAGPRGEELWSFWRDELAGEPFLELPFDRARSPERQRRAASCPFVLAADLIGDLRKLAQREAATLYTVLLGGYLILLGRQAGRSDVMVGSPVAGRSRPELGRVIGCLFNTVALRCDLRAELSFRELLAHLRGKVSAALTHQDYPSPLLAERLQPGGQATGTPFFSAQFIFQQLHPLTAEVSLLSEGRGLRLDLGDLVLEGLLLEPRAARSPLELELIEAGDGGVVGRLLYDADLFEAGTAWRMVERFQRLLAAVVADPDLPLGEIDLLDAAERELLLGSFSRSAGTYGAAVSLAGLFETQVAKTPHKAAAVDDDGWLTFGELDNQALRLAEFLRGLDA